MTFPGPSCPSDNPRHPMPWSTISFSTVSSLPIVHMVWLFHVPIPSAVVNFHPRASALGSMTDSDIRSWGVDLEQGIVGKHTCIWNVVLAKSAPTRILAKENGARQSASGKDQRQEISATYRDTIVLKTHNAGLHAWLLWMDRTESDSTCLYHRRQNQYVVCEYHILAHELAYARPTGTLH